VAFVISEEAIASSPPSVGSLSLKATGKAPPHGSVISMYYAGRSVVV